MSKPRSRSKRQNKRQNKRQSKRQNKRQNKKQNPKIYRKQHNKQKPHRLEKGKGWFDYTNINANNIKKLEKELKRLKNEPVKPYITKIYRKPLTRKEKQRRDELAEEKALLEIDPHALDDDYNNRWSLNGYSYDDLYSDTDSNADSDIYIPKNIKSNSTKKQSSKNIGALVNFAKK